jgi:hypothetical protein
LSEAFLPTYSLRPLKQKFPNCCRLVPSKSSGHG